ncbi:MAG: 2'-5' RNA ligase family protein [Burkholderiales bacterium]|nr:2'-5' RNA ligase family protein [Phycisphaerae bacterium]
MELNIHLHLPDAIAQLAISLNRKINKVASGEIHFSDPQQHIPHLTLTMGDLSQDVAVDTVLARARELAARLSQLRLATTHPYLARPSRKFVFLDVTPKPTVQEMKRSAYDAFSDLLTIPWAGQPDNDPHITVGYILQKQDVVETLLSQEQFSSQGDVVSIGVAEMGRRGTCVRLLQSFPLVT